MLAQVAEAAPTICVEDCGALWSALSSQSYDNFQPLNELVDNAIAAIGSAGGRIRIVFDFAAGRGSVEHSGGSTFPTDAAGLSRCFTYGAKQVSLLNEHGCGLKSSLAILDPTNTAWAIWIRTGAEDILRVAAPYTSRMSIRRETTWPGAELTAEPGSYIEFPIQKERFAELYTSKKAKMSDLEDLHARVRCHFSHMWMKQEDVQAGRTQLYYNGEPVRPFSFQASDAYECVETIVKKELTLSTGARVEIEEIKLRPGSKVPGSYKFKYSLATTGAVLFKNGRWIEFINGDDPVRKLYSSIFGSVPDGHHVGNLRLINMRGPQDQLPPTVPTKNRFQTHALLTELVERLLEVMTPCRKPDHVSEDSMVAEYKKARERVFATLKMPVVLEQEKVFQLDGVPTPKMDLVMTNGADMEVMEFKPVGRAQVDHFSQLFTNWTLARAANPGKTVRPVLVLADMESVVGLSEAHRRFLREFAAYGFRPVVRTNKDRVLYEESA